MIIALIRNWVCSQKHVNHFFLDLKEKRKMLRVTFVFSYKKSLKISTTRIVLSSFFENQHLYNLQESVTHSKVLQNYHFSVFFSQKEQREVANCVLKDMLHLVCM